MRLGRIGLGILAVAVALGAAGCGEGTPSPQAQGEVAGPVTKPRVAAFAREVQLTSSDFPGATVLPAEQDGGEDIGEQFSECTGSGLHVPNVASIAGPTFLYGERDERAAFSSQVGAAPTPYEARALVTLFGSQRGFHCLQRLLPGSIKASKDAEARDLSVSRLSTPLPPAPAAFGIRIGMTLVQGETRTRVFADEIGFASGPTAIVLTAFGTPTPVNQTVEAGLMESLYLRAVSTGF
jgi:hypothetical protein